MKSYKGRLLLENSVMVPRNASSMFLEKTVGEIIFSVNQKIAKQYSGVKGVNLSKSFE